MYRSLVFGFEKQSVKVLMEKAFNAGILSVIYGQDKSEIPAYDMLKFMCYQMGQPAGNCVAFMNSEESVRIAREAGCLVVAVGGDTLTMIKAGADLVISDLKEIADFKNVDEFNSIIDSMVKAFRDQTIIGRLIEDAKAVRLNAYEPFSHFKVGAAIFTSKGNIYKGCNVENASYGGTICAERGAGMAAIAGEGETRFDIIAIASQSDEPAPPCALCRQFLSQFMGKYGQVYLVSTSNGVVRHYNFGTVMPFPFTEF